MIAIKGVPVLLTVKEQTGTNTLGEPVYTETQEAVDNVLIGEPDSDQIVNAMNLHGKRIEYTLAIPKGDEHNWEDTEVSFWGKRFYTVGSPIQGIEDMIPLSWNKKVMVARYERED